MHRPTEKQPSFTMAFCPPTFKAEWSSIVVRTSPFQSGKWLNLYMVELVYCSLSQTNNSRLLNEATIWIGRRIPCCMLYTAASCERHPLGSSWSHYRFAVTTLQMIFQYMTLHSAPKLLWAYWTLLSLSFSVDIFIMILQRTFE